MPQILQDVQRFRGARAPARVCARRGHARRRAHFLVERAQQLERHRMVGHANSHRVQARAARVANIVCVCADADGKRPRPERLSERGRLHGHLTARREEAQALVAVGKVHDERVVGGAALGLEDPGYHGVVGAHSAQAIDGLRRERHRLAAAQRGGCRGNVVVALA